MYAGVEYCFGKIDRGGFGSKKRIYLGGSVAYSSPSSPLSCSLKSPGFMDDLRKHRQGLGRQGCGVLSVPSSLGILFVKKLLCSLPRASGFSSNTHRACVLQQFCPTLCCLFMNFPLCAAAETLRSFLPILFTCSSMGHFQTQLKLLGSCRPDGPNGGGIPGAWK